MSNKNQILGAAVAGILGASLLIHSPSAGASGAKTDAKDEAKTGQCVGANSCKGKGACSQPTMKHDCASKNACKGQGFLEKTKAECDKLAKADKKSKIHFESSAAM